MDAPLRVRRIRRSSFLCGQWLSSYDEFRKFFITEVVRVKAPSTHCTGIRVCGRRSGSDTVPAVISISSTILYGPRFPAVSRLQPALVQFLRAKLAGIISIKYRVGLSWIILVYYD